MKTLSVIVRRRVFLWDKNIPSEEQGKEHMRVHHVAHKYGWTVVKEVFYVGGVNAGGSTMWLEKLKGNKEEKP